MIMKVAHNKNWMKNVAITGAGGAIGGSLSEFLLRHSNCNLVLSYRSKETVPDNSRVKIVCGDIKSGGVLDSICEDSCVLIHLASTVNPVEYGKNWSHAYKYGADSTFALLEHLRSYTKRMHIIFPSSGGTVYSGRQKVNHEESDEAQGISPYGIQKIMFENYLKLLVNVNDNITCNVLRIANPYGVLLRASRKQGLIDTMVSFIRQKAEIKIWSPLETVRDYIYIDDLNKAFIAALDYVNNFDIFNIGSGTGTSIREIIEILQEELGHCVNYTQVVPNDVCYYPDYSVLNIEKASRVLKWRPSVNIRDGIKKIIERAGLEDSNEANKL